MRIPITKVDFDDGRILAMTQMLCHCIPELITKAEGLSALAHILGYATVDDLHGLAKPLDGASQYSRVQVLNHVAWRVSRRYDININVAHQITTTLNLRSLDVDACTFEAAQERHSLLEQQQGQYICIDEAWNIMAEHDKKEYFLEAGAPPYRVAVLANKSLFQWRKLEKLWDVLPSSFVKDLANENRYCHYNNDTEREVAFIKNELLPLCFTELSSSIKELQLLPHGFIIVWLFKDGGEHMGQCIGRVLYNRALGGIIPKLYSKDTDALFEDAALLLGGEIISVNVKPFNEELFPIYAKRAGGEGYDFFKDTKPSYGDTTCTAKDMKLFSTNIGYSVIEEHLELGGSVFVENGQNYIRCQDSFLIDVPVSIGGPLNVSFTVDQDVIAVEEHTRFLLAQQCEQKTFKESVFRTQAPDTILSLTKLIVRLLHPSNFNAYCDAFIDDDMPLDEDAAFNSDDATEKREELERLAKYGHDIKLVFPLLGGVKDTTLGYMLLLRHGTYSGGRSTAWFQAPNHHDMQDQSYYLLTCLLHVVGCNMKKKMLGSIRNFEALATIAVLILDGLADVTQLIEEYDAIDLFCKRMAAWGEFKSTVARWRSSELDLQTLRQKGEYWYVQSPVSTITFNAAGPGKSTLLYNLMLNARKSSVAMIQTTQSLADFI